jgi:outer membrane protein, heavy metal efflux system
MRPIGPFLTLTALASSVLAGCASTSTRGDYSDVRQLVHARSELPLPASSPQGAHPQGDPDARKLLAQPLTAASAERIALLQNHELRAKLHELGIARGQLAQASVLPNPEFEVEMRVPTAGGHDTEWSVGIGIPLAPLIVRGARAGAAEAELEVARYEVANAVLDLGVEVRRAYYAVLASQAHLRIVQAEVASFAASHEMALALHQAGNVTDLDLVTQRAAHEGARLAVADAEVALLSERQRLHVLLGLSGEASWQVDATLGSPPPSAADEFDVATLERKALDASLDLAQARAQASAYDGHGDAAQGAGWLSGWEVGAGGEFADGHWAVGPQLAGTLPVFDRGQGAAASARARAAQARDRLLATAQQVQSAVRTSSASVKAAAERARHCHEVVLPLRKEVVKQTLLQYNAMQIGVFHLLQVRREELETEHACVEAMRTYWTQRTELDALLAGRLAASGHTTPATRSLPTASAPGAAH